MFMCTHRANTDTHTLKWNGTFKNLLLLLFCVLCDIAHLKAYKLDALLKSFSTCVYVSLGLGTAVKWKLLHSVKHNKSRPARGTIERAGESSRAVTSCLCLITIQGSVRENTSCCKWC